MLVLSAHNGTIFACSESNIKRMWELFFFTILTHGDSAYTWQLYQPPPLANNSPILPKWATMLRDNSFLLTTVHYGCLITTSSLCAWLIQRAHLPTNTSQTEPWSVSDGRGIFHVTKNLQNQNQNVIFLTNDEDMPHCIRRKSDLMWFTSAFQNQRYLGHPHSPICSVF